MVIILFLIRVIHRLCYSFPFGVCNEERSNQSEIATKITNMEFIRGDSWDKLTEDCQDFIASIFTHDAVRPTARQLLQHPWITRSMID